jgi:hypothetical protein
MKTFYWYQAVIEFKTEDEVSGKIKKVKEVYLVKGVNPTDVETTLTKLLGETGGMSDYRVKDIKETNILKVIVPEGVEIED